MFSTINLDKITDLWLSTNIKIWIFMKKGIEVKLNAPNWPAQVKVGKISSAERCRLNREMLNTRRGEFLSRLRWSENGSPTGTTFPMPSIVSHEIIVPSKRPSTSGYLMRQCRACKMLYEGFHSCAVVASLGPQESVPSSLTRHDDGLSVPPVTEPIVILDNPVSLEIESRISWCISDGPSSRRGGPRPARTGTWLRYNKFNIAI